MDFEVVGVENLLNRKGNIIKAKIDEKLVDYYTPYSIVDIEGEYVYLTVIGKTKITDLKKWEEI